MKKKTTLFFLLSLIAGFLYRWYLASLATTTILYDMASYSRMAQELLSGHLTIDCCDHNPGYGIFVASVYLVSGMNNIAAVRLVQCLLELLTATLIFFTAKRLFGTNSAWYAFLLYLINPFTASYTGLVLSEVVTLCVFSLILFLISRPSFPTHPNLWFQLGLVLGVLLLIRASAPTLIASFIAYLVWFFHRNRRWKFFLVVCCGFLIPSAYTLVANYQYFHSFSLTPPYSLGRSILYLNFYNDRYPELLDHYYDQVNPEFYRLLLAFHRTYYTDVPAFQQEYNRAFQKKLAREWPLFLRNTLRNMVWIWDKNHLSYYTDPWYPADVLPLRVINILSLGLCSLGLGMFIREKKWQTLQSPVAVCTLLFAGIITFLYTLVSNETRHSIPFYAFAYLWAGYGVTQVTRIISTGRSRKK